VSRPRRHDSPQERPTAESRPLPRNKLTPRCYRCRMVDGACICETVPRLVLRTRLLLAFHFREWSKTTNTGHLAVQAVAGSRCALWGLGDGLRHVDGGAPDLWRGREAAEDRPWAFVLTMSDAAPLVPASLPPGPLCMVVPDGTWQQAAKLPRRIPELAGLPRYHLPAASVAAESSFHLRCSERPGALATLQAIALALGLIEGPAVAEALSSTYRAFVEGTLARRGPGRRRGPGLLGTSSVPSPGPVGP
jgi:DTW domain-containing protein YfiP